MAKEFICISCPRGCHLHVDEELNVTGNSCPRGITYGKSEATLPVRNISSIIPIVNGEIDVLPVCTSSPIPKEDIFRVMEEIKKNKVNAPVKVNDIIIKDILGLGVDIISSRTVKRRE